MYTLLDAAHLPIPGFLHHAYDINWFAAVRYVPQPYAGRVALFVAKGSIGPNEQWRRLAEEGVEVRDIPGTHENLLWEPQVEYLAREITDCLSKVECESAGSRRTKLYLPDGA